MHGARIVPPFLALLSMTTVGCWQGTTRVESPSGYFAIRIHSSTPILTSAKPAWITVDAENGSNERVQWGAGSGSCQLVATVSWMGEEWNMEFSRPCTTDIVPFALDPGTSRTEIWQWTGLVSRNGDPAVRLSDGMYAVYGAAGAWRSEKPIYIQVAR